MPKASKGGTKWYGVKRGRRTGVYATWEETQAEVVGFPGAVHKSFKTYEEAQVFVGRRARDFRTVTKVTSQKPLVSDGDPSDEEAPKPQLVDDVEAKPTISPATTATATSATESKAIVDASADPVLSPQQTQILKRILAGENYFFTGSAGTGKSVLLRAIIKAFKEREGSSAKEQNAAFQKGWEEYIRSGGKGTPPKRDGVQKWKLGVTASTGMAGVNIGGTTVHAWAGIGLGQRTAEDLLKAILLQGDTMERWQTSGALIIDEISMIDGKLLDKLDFIAKRTRQNTDPFGGLQLIVSGDFFQLPPVSKPGEPMYQFAFDAECWNDIFPRNNMSSLTRVFRQKEDDFVRILESMRKGRIKPADMATLKRCDRPVRYTDGIEPVALYPSRIEVANINNARLQALSTPLVHYQATDEPGTNSRGFALTGRQATELLDRNTIWPAQLDVKVGAMVMLVTNTKDGALVNGSTGIVVDFLTIPEAQKRGIPMPPLWIMPSLEVAWPVVEFVKNKHAVGRQADRTLIPQMFVDVMNAQGGSEATRHQVPLILAWALTIHKSQGQTLERVKVDLNKIFVEGQTYVAISRAVSLDTLEIKNFAPNKVMAHNRVIAWATPLEQEQAEDEEWDELLKNHDLDGY